jgi:CheY-like chemotaxis protein
MKLNNLSGKTILLVDDEADIREIISSELNFLGANVCEAENITKAYKICETKMPDLIISDIRMPGGTGIELLDLIKKNKPELPFILITGFADISLEDALDKGAEALLSKPFKLDDLIKTTLRLLSSFDFRFEQPLCIQKQESISFSAVSFKFGRGGVMMETTNRGDQVNPGDEINFHFTFNKIQLRGIGICRWVRSVSQRKNNILGIEFIGLDPNSLNIFRKLYHENCFIPFIPKFHS